MPKKKIVFVTYPTGREGTSALMGLIDAMGAPPVYNFKDARNPRGFFEDPGYFEMLRSQFPSLFAGVGHEPPSFDQIEDLVAQHIDAFHQYLERVFKRHSVLSIKSPKYLCLFQYKYLIERYDVRIVATGRNPESVVNSLTKMWSQRVDADGNTFTEEQIRDFVLRWQTYQSEVLRYFKDYPILETCFEDIVSNPHQVAELIARYIDVDMPSREVIDRCIDKKLVSRKDYGFNSLQYVSFKFHNLKEKLKRSF